MQSSNRGVRNDEQLEQAADDASPFKSSGLSPPCLVEGNSMGSMSVGAVSYNSIDKSTAGTSTCSSEDEISRSWLLSLSGSGPSMNANVPPPDLRRVVLAAKAAASNQTPKQQRHAVFNVLDSTSQFSPRTSVGVPRRSSTVSNPDQNNRGVKGATDALVAASRRATVSARPLSMHDESPNSPNEGSKGSMEDPAAAKALVVFGDLECRALSGGGMTPLAGMSLANRKGLNPDRSEPESLEKVVIEPNTKTESDLKLNWTDDEMKEDDDADKAKRRETILKRILRRLGAFSIDPASCWMFHMLQSIMYILHSFQIILIPLQLAWTDQFFSYDNYQRWEFFQIVIDLFSMVDCLMKCFLIYRDDYGVVVSDQRSMMRNYLWKQNGWVKLCASIPSQLIILGNHISPIEFMSSDDNYPDSWLYQWKFWALICFLKMILVTPFKQLYDIQIPRIAIPISRLIKTMIILMLMGHIDACVFWFLEQILPPGRRWVDVANLTPTAESAVTFQTQYLNSYLSALRSLVLKLREVTRDEENIFVIFEFVFGILAYGTVFGNIHSIVEMMDKSAASNQAEERHDFEMEWVRNYMRQKRIEPDIQKMVISHKKLQWERSKGMDESVMFNDLPKSVQQQIKNYLYLEMVRKVPIFKDCDSAFYNLLTFKITSLHVLDGWYIFRKGDEGEEMYFIKSGSVAICNDEGVVLVTLITGAFFGEIALFESCKRTASAKAVGNVELCTLKKDDFNYIMDTHPNVAAQIKETIRLRKEAEEIARKKKAEEDAKRELEEKQKSLQHSSKSRKFSASHIFGKAANRNLSLPKRTGSNMAASSRSGSSQLKSSSLYKMNSVSVGSSKSYEMGSVIESLPNVAEDAQ